MSSYWQKLGGFGALAVVASALGGCAFENAGEPQDISTAEQSLIGGMAAKSPIFNAIGVFYAPAAMDNGVCTAVLIGPTTVLTAKHCAKTAAPMLGAIELFIGIGPDVLTPAARYPVIGFDWETEVQEEPGFNFAELGSDVAVAYLASPVEGVTPLRIDRLHPHDLGSVFGIVGYGVGGSDHAEGKRRVGLVTLGGTGGNYADYALGGFEGFVDAAKDMPRFANSSLDEIAAEYSKLKLIPEYQAYVGGKPWNAQTCDGDSGAPLIALRRGGWRIVGLESGTFKPGAGLCDNGSVVSIFGPLTYAFIMRALENAP